VHRRELFGELEALALLAAGTVARAFEYARPVGAAQLAGRRVAEEDRARAFPEVGESLGRAALALEIAPHQGRQEQVLPGHAPALVGALRRMENREGAAAADMADELAAFHLLLGESAAAVQRQEKKHG